MIAVLKNTASEQQVEGIIEWIRSVGLDVHVSRGHYQTVLGLIEQKILGHGPCFLVTSFHITISF